MITPESIDPATDLPRGAIICLECGLSWAPFTAPDCWSCGRPGITSARAAEESQRTR